MPRLPALKAKELIKIAEKAGFIYDRASGSHHVYIRLCDNRLVVIPLHKNKDLGRGLTSDIIKQLDLNVEEALKLLKK